MGVEVEGLGEERGGGCGCGWALGCGEGGLRLAGVRGWWEGLLVFGPEWVFGVAGMLW